MPWFQREFSALFWPTIPPLLCLNSIVTITRHSNQVSEWMAPSISKFLVIALALSPPSLVSITTKMVGSCSCTKSRIWPWKLSFRAPLLFQIRIFMMNWKWGCGAHFRRREGFRFPFQIPSSYLQYSHLYYSSTVVANELPLCLWHHLHWHHFHASLY